LYTWTKPMTTRSTDAPRSHGRSFATAIAMLAVAAAANPSGRQQSSVATALAAAAIGVIFSACFIAAFPLRRLQHRRQRPGHALQPVIGRAAHTRVHACAHLTI